MEENGKPVMCVRKYLMLYVESAVYFILINPCLNAAHTVPPMVGKAEKIDFRCFV